MKIKGKVGCEKSFFLDTTLELVFAGNNSGKMPINTQCNKLMIIIFMF